MCGFRVCVFKVRVFEVCGFKVCGFEVWVVFVCEFLGGFQVYCFLCVVSKCGLKCGIFAFHVRLNIRTIKN